MATKKNKAPEVWSIPESEKDVHTEHCCAVKGHGCKYGEDDHYCTVVQGKKPQSFPCPRCLDPDLTTLDLLKMKDAPSVS